MTTVLDRFRLDDKVAIVTGASSGLGVAFAKALAEAGADVVLAARRAERLDATRAIVEQAGRRAIAVAADVARPEDATAIVEAAVKEFGHVDVLVNNAGKGTAVPATRETPAEFRAVIDINLNGCYWMAQACGRVMGPGSAIINVSSAAAFASGGLPQAAYSASKAGLIGLTRDLAVQWTGRKGIRVTAVAPGFFPSEMTDQFPDGYIDSQLPRLPAGPGIRRNSRQPSSSSPALRPATSPARPWSSMAASPHSDVRLSGRPEGRHPDPFVLKDLS
jgi:NAD(P)-dependent dehydrogenase (short-subunit alcohol dehydrogenase family)